MRTLALAGVALALAGSAAGCGGGDGHDVLDMFGTTGASLSPGEGLFNGEFDGESFTVHHALSVEYDFGDGTNSDGFVFLTDVDACGAFSSGFVPYGMRMVYLEMAVVGNTVQPPIGANEFPVFEPGLGSGTLQAFVTYAHVDESVCEFSFVNSVDGTVSVEDAQAGTYTGTADVETEFGESVSVAFEPLRCNAAQDLLDGLLGCE